MTKIKEVPGGATLKQCSLSTALSGRGCPSEHNHKILDIKSSNWCECELGPHGAFILTFLVFPQKLT